MSEPRSRLRSSPAVLATLALALGLGASLALLWWGPQPGAIAVPLPPWLMPR